MPVDVWLIHSRVPPKPEAERKEQLRSTQQTWIVAITSAITAVAAVTAAAFTLFVGIRQIDAAHAADLRESRAEAYSSYLESTTQFGEFIWGNLHWAGKDAPALERMDDETLEQLNNRITEAREAGRDAFFEEASSLQARLESDYAVAMMHSSGEEVDAVLIELHDSQAQILRQFKCLADTGVTDIQCRYGGDRNASVQYEWSTNATIEDALAKWDIDTGVNKTQLIAAARDDLN